jgi:hypothetical protein
MRLWTVVETPSVGSAPGFLVTRHYVHASRELEKFRGHLTSGWFLGAVLIDGPSSIASVNDPMPDVDSTLAHLSLQLSRLSTSVSISFDLRVSQALSPH